MKRPLPVVIVSVVAAMLVLTILGELFLPAGVDTLPTYEDTASPDTGTPAATANAAEDAAATMVSRPLFEQTRRPLPGAATAHMGPAASNDLPRLTGILIAGNKKQAIFQANAKDKPSSIGEGDLISGYTVKTITPDGVVVVNDAGEQTLMPSFDPSAALPETTPEPPAVTPQGMSTPPPNAARSPMTRIFQPLPPQAGPPAR